MRSPEYLSAKSQAWWVVLSLGVSAALTLGFLPTADHLLSLIVVTFGVFLAPEQRPFLSFPLLAALFAFSLSLRARPAEFPGRVWIRRSILPLLIALGYGLISDEGDWSRQEVLWYVVAAPMGEELLFRGWFMAFVDRAVKGKYFGPTNPLPASILLSALGFSLWHLQNAGDYTAGFMAFQLAYTFMLGIWLGYLRQETGKIVWPILAHIIINGFCYLL